MQKPLHIFCVIVPPCPSSVTSSRRAALPVRVTIYEHLKLVMIYVIKVHFLIIYFVKHTWFKKMLLKKHITVVILLKPTNTTYNYFEFF